MYRLHTCADERWRRRAAPAAWRRRQRIQRALTAVFVMLGLTGCTRQYIVSDTGPQAYYQTAFPIRDTSIELERIAASIYRIGVSSTYTTYRFGREDSVRVADVSNPATLARASERYTFDHSKAGTATVIGASATGVTLITNDHVTRTPDTVFVYFGDLPHAGSGAGSREFIESVSIRTRQTNFVPGLPNTPMFRVIARDSANDLALIRVDVPGADRNTRIQVLRVPMGDASRLTWGSFVYVLGYPRGYRMVTRGIVSDPGYEANDAFLLDGLFNRGISGGLILAVRGTTGALEWVGIASSAAAQSEFRLMPEPRGTQEDGILVPYDGSLYIQRESRIEYGITFPVSITAISRFLRSARVDD